jgi:hypothetical protein
VDAAECFQLTNKVQRSSKSICVILHGYRDDQCVSDGVVKLTPGGKYDLTWSIGTIQRFEKLASQQTATMAFESLERDIQDMAPHIKAQRALCRERFKRITDIFLEIQQET